MTKKNKGIICIIMAAFFFSLMTVCVRLAGDLPTAQKTVFRNLVAAVVSWTMLLKSGKKIKIDKSNVWDLIARAFFGTLGLICNFYAIDKLNISDANMLNKLSPFFAIVMSILILKEYPSKKEWISVVIAFIGAVFVIKPGFSIVSKYAFIGLLGGLGAGIAYTFVRKLGKKGVDGTIIVMFFSTFSTIVLLPAFIASYKPMDLKQVIILLLAGITATGGQLSITKAYTYAPAKEISVYDYTQVVFAAIWGFLFFGQIPDVYSYIGYGIILIATLLKFFNNKKIVL
ncbi:MAG: DMT family transporter [Agathobacter sp.]|nr:DMT family transporter [Agathobacter sp.]